MIKPLLLILLALCLFSIGLAYLVIPKYSFSIGVGVFVVAFVNTYFILRVFRYSGDQQSNQIVTSFLLGSMGKLSLAAGFFALVFVGVQGFESLQQADQAFALMLGFFMVYLAYIVLVAIWSALSKIF